MPTGAGPGRNTGLAEMLVVKLVSAVDEDMELSMGCIPGVKSEYKNVTQEDLTTQNKDSRSSAIVVSNPALGGPPFLRSLAPTLNKHT